MEVLQQNYSPLALSDASHPGWVYFIGNDREDRITIGHSNKRALSHRASEHRRNHPFAEGTHFLAAIKGDRDDETKIHTYFEAERIIEKGRRTEVFHASPRLVDYIVWLRDHYYVVADENEKALADIPVFPYDIWGPNSERVKPVRRERDLLTGIEPWEILPDRDLKQDDYYTPSTLIDRARMALGGVITLDPASDYLANQTVRADRFFCKSENGLLWPWSGRVWLNPPFAEWPKFAAKIIAELDHVDCMVVLANSRTVTARYFAPVNRAAKAIAILAGRYQFWGTDKDGSPSNGQVVLLMRGDLRAFAEAFRPIGSVFMQEECVDY